MNRDQKLIAAQAFTAALVEGVRLLGPKGVNEDQLYESVSTLADRKAFDMIVAELIEQRTFRRVGPYGLVYCGARKLPDDVYDA